MNWFIKMEKNVTPIIWMIEPKIFSMTLIGLKSPYPTVERVVKAKYMHAISLS